MTALLKDFYSTIVLLYKVFKLEKFKEDIKHKLGQMSTLNGSPFMGV